MYKEDRRIKRIVVGEIMIMKLNLNNRAFQAIINRTKRIEIRTNTDSHNYDELKINDLIEFTNDNKKTILCRVIDVVHYDSAEELLMLEGTKYTTSSTNDYQEAVERIYNLNGYRERIKQYGVYAIHLEYLYKIDEVWSYLVEKCQSVLNPRPLSNSVDAGGVAAALLTDKGNVYTGVCLDTACSLGFCAERNAIGSMITNGENKIEKLVCIGKQDHIMMPCGACRELLMQISDDNQNLEILCDLKTKETVKLKSLLPKYWK